MKAKFVYAKNDKSEGYYIFRRSIVKNGKVIYPKRAKAFKIWIKL